MAISFGYVTTNIHWGSSPRSGLKDRVVGVSFIVVDGNRFIVERRSGLKRNDPGIVAIPGGHVEEGEGLEEACSRELMEELGLRCDSFTYIWSTPHSTSFEKQTIHYYLCDEWSGVPVCNEAEEIFWITTGKLGTLEYEIDREAVRRLTRLLSENP
jgi:8-oxo-dGTP diphosphatase